MKLNLNTILFVLGALGLFAPDVLGLAATLDGFHVAFLVPVVKFLGWLATAMGGLAIAIPRLRTKLATLGLATPPGALAPWIPAKVPPATGTLDDTSGAVPPMPSEKTPVTIPFKKSTPTDPTA